MTDKFLDKAYGHAGGEAAQRFYNEWAPSYDEEITENGYASPRRCAAALIAAGADTEAPALDYGCGTGLSGVALRAAGFKTIDGVDPSPEMLRRAEPRRAYRVLRELELDRPFRGPAGFYRSIATVGVLAKSLAPPETLDQLLAILPEDGLIAFSLNDHTIADGAYEQKIHALIEDGAATLVSEDYGDHLPGIGLKSKVFVLRKT